MVKIVGKYVALTEGSKAPFRYFVMTFVAFVVLRSFLEIFSDRPGASNIPFEVHLHFYLFYLCVALTMTLLFSAATGEMAEKTARLILPSYFLILAAPVFDLIISQGQGYDMSYLLPHEHGDLLLRYLTFGGALAGGGITIGLRLEGVIVLAAAFLYFKAKGVSTLRGLFFVFAVYTAVFAYAIAPFIVKALLDVLNLFEGFSDGLMIKFYLIVATALLSGLAWKWNRDYFLSILRDTRPLRQLHAVLMFVCGVVLAPSLAWRQDTVFDLALVLLSVVCACLFVIMTNNLEKPSPITGCIPSHTYQKVAVDVGGLALVYAWAVSYYTLFTVLLCMGLYSLYSMPPLRIKRVPFLSKAPAALGSLACVVMGYVFAGGGIVEFSPLVTLWFLVPFAAAANLVDIKDDQEDKQMGIRTLPVLWGLSRSKLIVGLLILIAYVTAPVAFRQFHLLLPAVGVGLVQCWLVCRGNYQEKWGFSLYLLSVIVLLVSLGLSA